jgi:AbrB family looped-hinge helix DNA binding protein
VEQRQHAADPPRYAALRDDNGYLELKFHPETGILTEVVLAAAPMFFVLLLRSRCNTGYGQQGAVVVLNSKGQLTIPAHLRAKYGLHAGDEVEVVEVGGTLQIVRAEGAESRGQRLVRRLRGTATGQDVAGMSTDQIMALLRGE